MNEPFTLELTYQHKAMEFPAAFQRWGYTYRIVIAIHDINYVFEPDEEGTYRVLGTPAGVVPDAGLLRAIAEKLEKLQR